MDCLVHGYCKNSTKITKCIFPVEIIEICSLYYYPNIHLNISRKDLIKIANLPLSHISKPIYTINGFNFDIIVKAIHYDPLCSGDVLEEWDRKRYQIQINFTEMISKG